MYAINEMVAVGYLDSHEGINTPLSQRFRRLRATRAPLVNFIHRLSHL